MVFNIPGKYFVGLFVMIREAAGNEVRFFTIFFLETFIIASSIKGRLRPQVVCWFQIPSLDETPVCQTTIKKMFSATTLE